MCKPTLVPLLRKRPMRRIRVGRGLRFRQMSVSLSQQINMSEDVDGGEIESLLSALAEELA